MRAFDEESDATGGLPIDRTSLEGATTPCPADDELAGSVDTSDRGQTRLATSTAKLTVSGALVGTPR